MPKVRKPGWGYGNDDPSLKDQMVDSVSSGIETVARALGTKGAKNIERADRELQPEPTVEENRQIIKKASEKYYK